MGERAIQRTHEIDAVSGYDGGIEEDGWDGRNEDERTQRSWLIQPIRPLSVRCTPGLRGGRRREYTGQQA